MAYRFISDPGHGWLEVPAGEVVRLGLRPTRYSYEHDGMVYLEEDCDAGPFIKAKRSRGEPCEIVDVYEANTAIRSYRHYAA